MSYPPGPPPGGAYPPPGGYPPGPPSGGGYPPGPPGGAYPPGPPGAPGGGYPGGGYPGQPGYGGQPPKQSKAGLFIGLAVGVVLLIVVAAVAVVFLLGGTSSIDEAEAAASLDTIVDEADFEDTDGALRSCPLGDLDVIVATVGSTLDQDLDLGDDSQFAFEEAEDFEAGVLCFAVEDEDDDESPDATVFATPVPGGDYPGAVEGLYPDDDVTVEEPEGYRGGDIYRYCVEPGEDSGSDGCGADWVGEELAVGVVLLDLDADAEQAEEVLRDSVGDMIDALAEAEPDFEE